MSYSITNSVYAIYDTHLKLFKSTNNGKMGFATSGAAKTSFMYNMGMKFDNQDRYKIVRLDSSLVESNFLL